MAFQKIGVVTSVPAAGAANAPGKGAAANALKVDLGQVLEITGKNAGGAGTAVLLRWFPPPQDPAPAGFSSNLNSAGEWRRWREDAPMICAAGTDFSGRYELPRDSTEYWMLLAVAGDGTPDLTADAQGAYYRGGP